MSDMLGCPIGEAPEYVGTWFMRGRGARGHGAMLATATGVARHARSPASGRALRIERVIATSDRTLRRRLAPGSTETGDVHQSPFADRPWTRLAGIRIGREAGIRLALPSQTRQGDATQRHPSSRLRVFSCSMKKVTASTSPVRKPPRRAADRRSASAVASPSAGAPSSPCTV